jgi:hypothetical protein
VEGGIYSAADSHKGDLASKPIFRTFESHDRNCRVHEGEDAELRRHESGADGSLNWAAETGVSGKGELTPAAKWQMGGVISQVRNSVAA